MHIEVRLKDGVPIYRQIFNQLRYQIVAGRLAAGEELPTIRGLAEQLSITPNTVAKAYDALEAAKLVVKRQGAGTFVASEASPLKKSEARRLLTERVDALLAESRQLNCSYAELLEIIARRHAVLERP